MVVLVRVTACDFDQWDCTIILQTQKLPKMGSFSFLLAEMFLHKNVIARTWLTIQSKGGNPQSGKRMSNPNSSPQTFKKSGFFSPQIQFYRAMVRWKLFHFWEVGLIQRWTSNNLLPPMKNGNRQVWSGKSCVMPCPWRRFPISQPSLASDKQTDGRT